MLQITIEGGDLYDEDSNQFMTIKSQTIQLEHSLVSLSKWESKWKKPFLGKEPKTYEQTIDYVRCMTLTQNVNPLIYAFLTNDQITEINRYNDDPMTATWFSNNQKKGEKSVVTAEIIYYWMIALEIPFECQKWHLNRLLTLVHVCDEKNSPSKKMSAKDIAKRNRSLNAQRRSQLHTKG